MPCWQHAALVLAKFPGQKIAVVSDQSAAFAGLAQAVTFDGLRQDHGGGAPVFNRTVTLKDSWGKGSK